MEKKFRGAYTVEASFIIPLMIFSVFAIIYLSITHYQSIVSVAEATGSANRVAAYWSYIGYDNPPSLKYRENIPASDLITLKMYDKRSPYRFLTETIAVTQGGKSGGSASKRVRNGRDYTKSRIAGIKFHHYNDSKYDNVEMKTEMGFLSSFITVKVKKRYINPLGNIMVVIGVKDKQDFESKSSSLITNPSEFIRNIDMISQMGYYLKSYIKK
jgi:hypothetical protein